MLETKQIVFVFSTEKSLKEHGDKISAEEKESYRKWYC